MSRELSYCRLCGHELSFKRTKSGMYRLKCKECGFKTPKGVTPDEVQADYEALMINEFTNESDAILNLLIGIGEEYDPEVVKNELGEEFFDFVEQCRAYYNEYELSKTRRPEPIKSNIVEFKCMPGGKDKSKEKPKPEDNKDK